MQVKSSPTSWTVRESAGDPLVLALYVRDRAGLRAEQIDVPALEPFVSSVMPDPLHMKQQSNDWSDWWRSLVARTATSGKAALDDNFEVEFGRNTESFDISFAESSQWLSNRTLEQITRQADQTRLDRRVVSSAVQQFEEAAGRSAVAFTLDLVILPVVGNWSFQVTPNLIFLSRNLRSNAKAFSDLLSPILSSIG